MEYSHPITEKQYNYLLPVYGIGALNRCKYGSLYQRRDKYYFIGTNDDYKDMLQRCLYL